MNILLVVLRAHQIQIVVLPHPVRLLRVSSRKELLLITRSDLREHRSSKVSYSTSIMMLCFAFIAPHLFLQFCRKVHCMCREVSSVSC